jgi:uncharacterized protein YodC (DUF2158 family)
MFKPGDTVRLKSGGPVMTVSEAWNNGWLKAAWFLEGQVCVEQFHSDMLNAVTM